MPRGAHRRQLRRRDSLVVLRGAQQLVPCLARVKVGVKVGIKVGFKVGFMVEVRASVRVEVRARAKLAQQPTMQG